MVVGHKGTGGGVEVESKQDTSVLDADSSSTKSGRRPSVDTVSTYLSHESEMRTSRVRLHHNLSITVCR